MSRFHIVTFLFFFNDTATTEIYTLSLHDALPICRNHLRRKNRPRHGSQRGQQRTFRSAGAARRNVLCWPQDRKSTRLNSSHTVISYAVFCLKKKKKVTRLL